MEREIKAVIERTLSRREGGENTRVEGRQEGRGGKQQGSERKLNERDRKRVKCVRSNSKGERRHQSFVLLHQQQVLKITIKIDIGAYPMRVVAWEARSDSPLVLEKPNVGFGT